MAIDIKNERGGMNPTNKRLMTVAIAITFAVLTAYGYAVTTRSSTTPAFAGNGLTTAFNQVADTGAGGGAGGAGGGCGMSGGAGGAGGGGCCGGGGPAVAGEAKVEGNVQKIDIDTSKGTFEPNEITLKAGVPTEITFPPSGGCVYSVLFPDFGINQDLQQGATVKLPAMEPGEYQWSCGMNMITGKLIVK